jgi:hypothetical protein
MKVGVTGTRSDINQYQIDTLYRLLPAIGHGRINMEFHHGDCVGADVTAAEVARHFGYKIVCHPPEKNDLRAFFDSDEHREPLSYFARNRNIVDETQCLLVLPYQTEWQTNGGTWYTYDYAKKKNKPRIVIYPNDRFDYEGFYL